MINYYIKAIERSKQEIEALKGVGDTVKAARLGKEIKNYQSEIDRINRG